MTESKKKNLDVEDVHAKMAEEVFGSSNDFKGAVLTKFDLILESFREEDAELEGQIRFHERALASARARRHNVRSILGVLTFLKENLFDLSVMRRSIRDVLTDRDGTSYTSYRMLMERLQYFMQKKKGLRPERSTAPEDEIPFWCPDCGLGFRDEDDFNLHRETKCEYTGDDAFRSKRKAAEEAIETDKALRCPVCGFKAKSAAGLKAHMRVHEKKVAKKKVAKKKVAKKKVAKKKVAKKKVATRKVPLLVDGKKATKKKATKKKGSSNG